MPRKCTVCNHPRRMEIDKMIISSIPFREITRQFKISKDSISRHKNHLSKMLLKARDVKETANADNLLTQIKQLHKKAFELLSKAESENDYRTALMGIREARGCLEVLAKLSGELNDNPTINILLNPEYLNFRHLIINTLDEYPEAKLTLINKLETISYENFN